MYRRLKYEVIIEGDDQVQDQDDQEEDPSNIAFDLATTNVVVNDEALMEMMVISQEKFAEQ